MSDHHTSLTLEEYKRYGRQMILRGFGLPGQLKLKNAKVAVIGAGGLGCPALQYLAGAGTGTIGIFDFDTVEESNLHRQVLHTTSRVGEYKAESAKLGMIELNPHITVLAHTDPILPSTAIPLLSPYDIILDCTDRPQTRYLINDVAVRLDIPLISGAAIEWAGQWAVLGGYHQAGLPSGSSASSPTSTSTSTDPSRRARWTAEQKGKGKKRPCYRCLFPKPLPRSNDQAGTCEEEGVFGPIVGVVGVQMAAETIKVILGVDDPGPKLNLISLSPALSSDPSTTSTPFRSIRVRGPSLECRACGPEADIGDDLESVGYDAFCGVGVAEGEKETSRASADGGMQVESVSVDSLKRGFFEGEIPDGSFVTGVGSSSDPAALGGRTQASGSTTHKVLIDVREEMEFGLCSLPGSINIPMKQLLLDPVGQLRSHTGLTRGTDSSTSSPAVDPPVPDEIYLVCRRGNDSLVSAQALRRALDEDPAGMGENGAGGRGCKVMDVRGGVRAWSKTVDSGFPMY